MELKLILHGIFTVYSKSLGTGAIKIQVLHIRKSLFISLQHAFLLSLCKF